MESPPVTWKTVWDVYNKLLFRFQNLSEATECIEEWSIQVNLMDIQPEEFEAREQGTPNLMDGKDLDGGIDKPHANGSYYMGGVNNGRGLGTWHNGPNGSTCQQCLITSFLDTHLIRELDRLDDEGNDDDFEPLEAQFSSDDEDRLDPEEQDMW